MNQKEEKYQSQQHQAMRERFICEICDDNFGQKGNLQRHLATVHEGKKQFKCSICNKNFEQKRDLNKHVATVHEGKKV